jgi:hypothetical protein
MAVTNVVPVTNQLTLAQEALIRAAEDAKLRAAIENVDLPPASLFKSTGDDIIATTFILTGHTGGSLLDVLTGDIIFPEEDTGYPESIFTRDGADIVFGAA